MTDAFDAEKTEGYRLQTVKYTPNDGNIGVGFNGAEAFKVNIKDLPDTAITKPPANLKDMAYYVFSVLAKDGFNEHGETKTQKELEDLMKDKADTLAVAP